MLINFHSATIIPTKLTSFVGSFGLLTIWFLLAMDSLQKEFRDWLVAQLQILGLDDSAYVEYIEGMIFMEDDSPSSERTDAVADFISAATVHLNDF